MPLLAAAFASYGEASLIGTDAAFAASDVAWLTCRPQTAVRVYFGTQMPEGEVNDAAWQGFVADVVTPRFADGFTVIDARGQWRDPDGRVMAERSRVLEIIGTDDRAHRKALVEMVAAYKVAFRQQAVLVTWSDVQTCM